MRLFICVSDTDTSPNLMRADDLDQSLLYDIRQRLKQEIRSVSSTELDVSETTTFHFFMAKSALW